MALLHPLSQIISPHTTDTAAFDYDPAIVGGGIVGLTLACAFKRFRAECSVMEAKPHSVAAAKASLRSSHVIEAHF